MRGDEFHFSQMRLYYIVYICDHHFSIAYGRPPLTRDYEEITKSRDILSLPQATEDDARLVSQVELWSITSKVLETFGFDVELSPTPSVVSRMRRFAIEYDTWRADWNDRFGRHVHVGNYPRKGVKLHVTFAKLYLCSHAFRGLPMNTAEDRSTMDNLGTDVEDMATAAVYSAQNILETMVSDTEIQEHLNGLPLYFNTMIVFAVVFLFKIATKFSHVMNIDVDKTLRLLTSVENILESVTSNMSNRHLLTTVSKAIETLLNTVHESREAVFESTTACPGYVATPMRLPPWLESKPSTDNAEMTDMSWEPGSDFDWMAYDFLASDGTFVHDVQYRGD